MSKYAKEWLTLEEWERLVSLKMLFSDMMMLYLLYGCALRVSEMCSLKVADIDFDRELIIVRKSKNQPDPKAVPLSQKVLGLLKTYIENKRLSRNSYLFTGRRGQMIHRKVVYDRVKRLAKHAKIEKAISTHTFRRSRITHLIDAGMPIEKVQMLAGHKSINTTSKYYKYSVAALKKAMAEYDPLERGEL